MPYIGQEALHKKYDFNRDWSDPGNDQGVIQTRVRVLECPFVPSGRTGFNDRGFTDYSATCDLDPKIPVPFLNPAPKADKSFVGVLGLNVSRKLSEVTDGTSTTLLVAEDAGRGQEWQMGKLIGPDKLRLSAWANPLNRLRIAGFDVDRQAKPGLCAINCSNDREVYSFHPGGANALFADGAVHFLLAPIDLNIMVRLFTRNQGEVIPPGIY